MCICGFLEYGNTLNNTLRKLEISNLQANPNSWEEVLNLFIVYKIFHLKLEKKEEFLRSQEQNENLEFWIMKNISFLKGLAFT